MTEPYYMDERVRVVHGDCLDVMRDLPDASVDAVVTDPPYGLEFMGKEWDSFGRNTSNGYRETPRITDRSDEDGATGYRGAGGLGINHFQAGPPFQSWCVLWASEALRVLKPGGHLLAFGGTRTWHRLVCAVEDAGFEIRDSLAWLYGQGFPKSHNLTGEWMGWGTALKPAFEPIVVARKPLTGTVAANVLAHGTGALNVDGCRIGFASGWDEAESKSKNQHADFGTPSGGNTVYGDYTTTPRNNYDPPGRWPANVILDESQAAELDRQSGHQIDGVAVNRNRVLRGASDVGYAPEHVVPIDITFGGAGGASRFFYTPKADSSERPRVDGVAHPTVKPLALMRWLARLVTPPGGLVLEPFAGSGTTVEACLIEGFRCIAIERETTYLPLILRRISKPIEVTLL